jgi:autotransporter-associated beta strand protein
MKSLRLSDFSPARAAALALALLASPALLVDHASAGTTWDGNAAATTGNWEAALNWEGVVPTFDATTDLLFRNFSTNNRTTSVIQAARTVRSLTFNSNVNSGFEIRLTTTTNSSALNLTMGNASNAAAITVNSGAAGNITIGKGSGSVSGNLILANNLMVTQDSTSATLIIDAPIIASGGTYGITKNGTGLLTLSGNNTYNGTTTINAGTLEIGGAGRLGGGSYSSNIAINGLTSTLIYNGTSNQILSGAISGNGSLTKNNTGTLTLSGASKTITGNVTVNGGTLSVSSGALDTNITVNSGATLTAGAHYTIANSQTVTLSGGTLNVGGLFVEPGTIVMNNGTVTGTSSGHVLSKNGWTGNGNNTINNKVSLESTKPGSGLFNIQSGTTTINSVVYNYASRTLGITKNGTGALVLNGNNTYAGTTTLNNGTLVLNSATALGTSALTIVSGTIDNTSGSAKTLTNNNTQNWNGNFTFLGTNGSLDMGSGTVSMNASRTVTVSNGTFTVGGIISGSGFGLTKNGAGTLLLTGANTFTGATTINAGTLSIASITNGGVAGSLGNSTNATGNLVLGGGSLLYTGSNASTDRNFTLTASTTSEINVSNAATELTISGTSASTNGALTKNGSGTLILSGNNGHSGATTINAGTLVLSGTNTGSAITINSGGSLLSNTSLGSTTVNSGGAIASGTSANSVGSLTVAGLTLNSGGTFTWDMSNATGAAGTGWDRIVSSGLLTIGATSGAKFTIAITSSGVPANWDYTNSGQTWDIFTYGSLSGFSADKFAYDVSAFGGSYTPDSSWALSDTGSALRLTYTYSATTPTWNGASGNWSSGFTPAVSSGANLNFIGAGGTSTNNILSGNLSSIGSLLFTGTGAYTLQANSGAAGYDAPSALAIGSDITNSSTGTQTINLAISFAANHTISATSGDIVIGGPISGVGSITKQGSNALTLSGCNTYSGGTTLSAGQLNINSTTALGTGTLTITGGTLDNTSGSSITLSNNNAQNWNSDFSFAGTNDLNLGTGAVAMDASRTVTISNGNLTVGGVIAGSGFGLTKSGSGTLTLNGNNTYSGGTTINAGAVVIGHAGGLATSGNVTFTGGGLQYGNGITTDISSRIKNSTSAILLNTNGNDLIFSGVVDSTNAGGLIKNGSGTLTLTAANTYTGETTVNAGTLQIGNRTNTTAAVAGTITLSGGNLTYDFNNSNFAVNGAITLTAESSITKLNAAYQYNFSGGTLNGGGQTLNIYSDTSGGTKGGIYFNQTAGTSLGQVNILNGYVGQSGTGGLPLRNAAIDVSSGAQFQTYSSPTINNNITLNGGAGPDNNGALYNSGGGAATYSGTISLASSSNSSIGTAGGNITISGQVTGSGSLTKIGANTLALSNSTTNYTGTTTVSAGTLAISNNMTIGAITGSGNLSLGTGYTLTTNSSSDSTYSGLIIGSGSLTKSGTSTLSIPMASTYTGATTVNGGTLRIENLTTNGGADLKNTPGSDFNINNGSTLVIHTNVGGNNRIISNNDTFTFDSNGGGTLEWSGGNVLMQGSNYHRFVTLGGLQNVMTTTNAGYWNGQGVGLLEFTVADGSDAVDLLVSSSILNALISKNGTGTMSLRNTTTGNYNITIEAGTLDVGGSAQLAGGTYSANLTTNGTFSYSSSADQTLSGVISGTGALTKNSSSTLTLSGNNNYTGLTTITAGTLAISNNMIIGAITGSGNLSLGTGFALISNAASNSTFSGAISGSGALTKAGSGTLTLNGSNTFSGAITINGGSLVYQAPSAFYTFSPSGININNGSKITIEGSYGFWTPKTFTFDSNGGGEMIIGSGNNVFRGDQTFITNGGSQNIISGTYLNCDNAGTRTFIIADGTDDIDLLVSASLQNTMNLDKTGAGKISLTANNTYTGNTTISAGILEIGGAGRLGGGTYAANITNNATFLYSGTNNQILSGVISGTGALTHNAASKLTLAGNNTYSGGTTISAGTLEIASTGLLGGGNYTGNIANAGAFLVGTNSNQTLSGVISGIGALTKNGTGTLTLAGNNNFSGGTTLNTGILVIGNAAAAGTGTITQTSGSSLLKFDTTGTITNDMSVYNVLASQSATLSGAITVNNATWDIDTGDTLTISGAVSGSGGVTKNGNGTLVLSGNNSYSGATVVNAGTLNAANANALGSNNTVTVNDGTLLVSADDAINNKSVTLNSTSITVAGLAFSGTYGGAIGTLTLSADSIIDLGTGSVSIMFTNFDYMDFVAKNFTLDIYNWTGTTLWNGGTGNDTDKVYFGPDLSDAALAKIYFHSGAVGGGDSFLGTGFDLGLKATGFDPALGHQIIPVPEPETYATGLLLLLSGAWWMWKRNRKAV